MFRNHYFCDYFEAKLTPTHNILAYIKDIQIPFHNSSLFNVSLSILI